MDHFILKSTYDVELFLSIESQSIDKLFLRATFDKTDIVYSNTIDAIKYLQKKIQASIDNVDGYSYECALDDQKLTIVIHRKYDDDIVIDLIRQTKDIKESIQERSIMKLIEYNRKTTNELVEEIARLNEIINMLPKNQSYLGSRY